MQQNNKKITYLKETLGKIFTQLRLKKNISINQLAFQYDIDKGSLSKLERGVYDCRISTAIKLAQANGIKFSEFAKLLENELGENFSLIDE
ncbi:helix-turn-helix transcriptional regulator [bacterium]|nr:helix-turn-helix transcriptional regulator [bacterium]